MAAAMRAKQCHAACCCLAAAPWPESDDRSAARRSARAGLTLLRLLCSPRSSLGNLASMPTKRLTSRSAALILDASVRFSYCAGRQASSICGRVRSPAGSGHARTARRARPGWPPVRRAHSAGGASQKRWAGIARLKTQGRAVCPPAAQRAGRREKRLPRPGGAAHTSHPHPLRGVQQRHRGADARWSPDMHRGAVGMMTRSAFLSQAAGEAASSVLCSGGGWLRICPAEGRELAPINPECALSTSVQLHAASRHAPQAHQACAGCT